MATEMTVKAPRGLARSFDPAVLIGEWREDMRSRVEAGEMARNTAVTYRRGMAKFWTWFQGQDAYKNVGPRAIRSWFAHMRNAGRKPNGIATHYAGVRAFFAWAVAERGLAYNPCATVKSKGGGKRHKRDPLSDAEVLRVLAQPDTSTPAGKRARGMLALMAYTGVRTIEVQRARVGDLRSNGKLKLYVHGKGHDEADEVVYLVHPDVVDAMYDWLAVHPRGDDLDAPLFCGLGNRNHGGALTTSWIRYMVKDLYRQAGIRDPRKTTHSLRHALVTNLIRHKVPAVKIMTVTRHKSLDTILTYAHEVDRDSDPAEGYVDYSDGNG
jgi:site-specific recombinase XerD